MDPLAPEEEQFGVIAEMQNVGLSEVSIEHIKTASRFFPVVSVQNMFNLVTRKHEGVLEYCEQNNIGFIPWFPLGAGSLAKPGPFLGQLAKGKGYKPSQIALAWLLKRSPVILPIPGTSRIMHLAENVAAANIELTEEEFRLLDMEGREAPETPGPGA